MSTARVIFMAKTSWTYSVLVENKFGLFQVLGDRITWNVSSITQHIRSTAIENMELEAAEIDKRPEKIEHKQTAPFVQDEAEQEGQAGQQVQPGNRALKKTVCRCSAKI